MPADSLLPMPIEPDGGVRALRAELQHTIIGGLSFHGEHVGPAREDFHYDEQW